MAWKKKNTAAVNETGLLGHHSHFIRFSVGILTDCDPTMWPQTTQNSTLYPVWCLLWSIVPTESDRSHSECAKVWKQHSFMIPSPSILLFSCFSSDDVLSFHLPWSGTVPPDRQSLGGNSQLRPVSDVLLMRAPWMSSFWRCLTLIVGWVFPKVEN